MSSNKSLLMEYRTFNVSKEQLNEAVRSNGEFFVEGILTKKDEQKNQNGRIYPAETLVKEVLKYKSNFVDQNRALGELDHPESSVINLKNVSHNIVDCWWDGDNLVGKVKILTTPSGNILRELFKSGIAVGISSRAMGSVQKVNESTVVVQEDLELICFDFVSNPSCIGAFMSPVGTLSEGVSNTSDILNNKWVTVESLVRDILIEIK